MNLKYQMIIQWSEEDDCYLVSLPGFNIQKWCTHGDTYEEAAKNGREVLELLVETSDPQADPLPEPDTINQIPISRSA